MRRIFLVVFFIVSIARFVLCEETSTTNSRNRFSFQSKDEVKQAIFSVWNDFRKTLSEGDINKALNYISTEQREDYRRTLTQANQYVSKIADSLNDIENCEIETNALQVNCEMFNKVNGELRSHYIEFVRDYDGMWRIAFF